MLREINEMEARNKVKIAVEQYDDFVTKNRLFRFVFMWKDQQCDASRLTGNRYGGRIKRLAGIGHNFYSILCTNNYFLFCLFPDSTK